MKQYITKALLCLSVAMLVFNCQKEDDSLELQNTAAPSSKPLNLSRLNTKAIKNDKNLMRIITKAETKRIEAKANKTVYNAQYDFTINTNYAKVITKSNGLKNYTFGVYRTEDNGLLENLLLETQNDGTFKVSLVQYNITTDERNALTNQEIVDVEDKITFTTLEDISDTIFDKVNSDAETCTVYSYEMYQGNSCASGNHEYTDGAACNYWGNPDQMATSGGYVLTANEESCGDGGGSTGYTDGSPNGNPSGNQSGGYGSNGTSTIEDPATTPVLCTDCPEISEDDECPPIPNQLLNQLETTFGIGNVNLECDTPIEDAQFDSIEGLLEYFNNIEETSTEGETTTTQLNTKKDDRYFKLQTLPALVKLKCVTKYELPTNGEGINLISVTTSIIGNESISHWTSDDEPTSPTYTVNEQYDYLRIQISGNLKTGLYVPALQKVVGITKSYNAVIKYKYTTGEFISAYLTAVN